jgi:type IV fimbrial biogenesis protein FimT
VLSQRQAQRGVSLVELMIGLVVFALLIALSAPAFSTYVQNTKIRTAAESIQNGLQLARAEAVRRNTAVRFQFTDTATNSCSLSATGRNWVISLDDPTGKCEVAPSETVAPQTIQKGSAEAGSSATVEVTPDTQPLITFNGMGRVNPVPATDISIDIKNLTHGACATSGSSGGAMRCLRVVVSRGGQVRMCDPARASTDPQVC